MNALEAVTDKIRLELIVNKADLVVVNSRASRGLVKVEVANAVDPSRKVAQLCRLFVDRNDASYVNEMCGLACRSRQHKVASALAFDLLQKCTDGISVTVSLPFAEGDAVIVTDNGDATGGGSVRGTVVMQTSPTHYAVRLDVDGKVRSKMAAHSLRAGERVEKKVHLSIPLRKMGRTREEMDSFFLGFVMLGPKCHRRLFPSGIQNEADAEIDISRCPGLFCGSNDCAESCIYTLGVLLDMYAMQRTSLDLSSNWIGPSGIKSLSPSLNRMSRLRELRLGRNGISVDGAKYLANILKNKSSLPHLHHLDLHRNALGPEGIRRIVNALVAGYDERRPSRVASATNRNMKLRLLDLSSNFAGDLGARYLSDALVSFFHLEILRFKGNEISSTGAKYIVSALSSALSMTDPPLFASRLRELDVSYNNIGYSGIDDLASSLSRAAAAAANEDVIPPLTVLNLRRVGMGTKGAERLAQVLPSLSSLVRLDVSGNDIKREGGEKIYSAVTGLADLVEMPIGSNSIGVRLTRSLDARFRSHRRSENSVAIVPYAAV